MPRYHRPVIRYWPLVAGWYHASVVALLPWVAAWRPHWTPLLVAMAVLAYPAVSRERGGQPWTSAVKALSALVFVIVFGGWTVAGAWLGLAAVVWLIAVFAPRPQWRRPDVADAAALVGWATVLASVPGLMNVDRGGWLAPGVLLLAVRRLAASVTAFRAEPPFGPTPPTREVRGTLSLRGVVASSPEGYPRTVPIDLELRAGESLAVLCDSAVDRDILAGVLSGRVAPSHGEVAIDGVPVEAEDRLVAVVAPGERFVIGSVEDNVGTLSGEVPERATLMAVTEACGLDDVAKALGEAVLAPDGAPLEPVHRLLLLAARVIPSHYRIVVIVDPMPWVNTVVGQRWRSAVVRASVGRTAVWITPDRELAVRADRVLQFRENSLRAVDLSSVRGKD
jgi:ABC-type transport system involved in cytochrome bd biosynthesis fused ATPase/permease subunit